ncbi:MAG: hypothetical protein QXG35_08920 [Nitrososphaerota archaeon]
MLLYVRGRWHRPLPNEPLIPPGWKGVFRLVAGSTPNDEHCSMILLYKHADFESFAVNEVVEAASKLNVSKAVKLAVQTLLSAPDVVLELDNLPSQVVAASALSQHEVVRAHVKGGSVELSALDRLSPLEILRAVYARPREGFFELRSMISGETWEALRAAANLQGLTPKDAMAILRGDREKLMEVVNLLKTRALRENAQKKGFS